MYRRIAAPWLCLVVVFGSIMIIIEIIPTIGGTTITVDDSGGADFFTITMAINAANEGDTVYVYSGTYYEHVIVDKTINLTGEDRDTTTIDGQGVGDVVHISANWVNVSGFSVIDSGPNGNPRDAGIEVNNAHNATISGNFFTDNRDAIYIYYSNNSIITNNIVDDFEGIDISHSGNITISGNIISTQYDGISLDFSIYSIISDNTMTDTGFVLSGIFVEHWNTHDIDTSNTINGKPVYYWKNQTAGTVPSGAGQVILANCTNVNVENQQISDSYIGILLGFSNKNLITSNNISSTEQYGIYLFYSDNNTFSSNTFWNNDYSLWLSYSNENNISDNYALDNWVGIDLLASNGNIISDNTLSDGIIGIMLGFSNGNIINNNYIASHWSGAGIFIFNSDNNVNTRNTLIDNNWGFNITDSYNNLIYHNNIISNAYQAYDDTISGNQWDNGYPSGGNYWDDYSGADKKNGANQDISGGDGIGDSPYAIEIDTFDNYPLMEPWGVDTTPPAIELISPSNNSFIDIGTKINLSVSDLNLDEVTYSINSGANQILNSPYDIDTGNWNDGDYEVEVQAKDTSDNVKTAVYHFYVDTVPPAIALVSPVEGSYIGSSPEIELTISDTNLDEVLYSLNSQNQILLSDPYIIDGSSWPEGGNTLLVHARDQAGNSNEELYVFTKDSIAPEIILTSPDNESMLIESFNLDFDISDNNLETVSYSINVGSFITFTEPYYINAAGWDEGEYVITIKAVDLAGNVNKIWFVFNIDTSSPTIKSSSMDNYAEDVSLNSEIEIEFSEPMDTESVESALSIDPYTEYSLSWSNDNKTLTITFTEPLEYDTFYKISIGTQANDMAGKDLEDKYELGFTTIGKPKAEEEEFQIMYLILAVLLAVILAVVIVVMAIAKKKKTTSQTVVPQPQVLAQSQPQQQLVNQSQPLQQTIPISCPNCFYRFSVVRTGSPRHVTCPNCKTSGMMN